MANGLNLVSVVKKKLKNQTVKASIGYTIGNYLLKGIGFITVPIFARLMTQEDFGNYNTFLAYEGIIYLFVSLALHVSIKNARYEYGESNLNGYTSSISLIPMFMVGLYLAISNIFPGFVGGLLNLNRFEVNLLLIYCYSSGMLIFYHNRLALDYRYKEYLKLSYVNTFAHIIFSIFLMLTVFSEQRYMARILGSVVPLAIITVYILVSLWNREKPRVNLDYWRFGLKLSIPIIPHGIGQVVLLSFDRIMINRYIGAKEAGIYSFAYTIFTIIQITSNSLSTVFEPWAFKQLNEHNNRLVREKATQFFLLLCAICGGVIIVAPEMILILGSEKYASSIYCVIPVLLGGIFSMTYAIPSVLTYFYKKTQFIAAGTMAVAVLNILLNAIFIKKYGYVAAAYTTLVCYILYFIYHYYLAYRISGFKIIDVSVLLFCFFGLAVICVLTFLTLEMTIVRLLIFAVSGILCGAYILRKYKERVNHD